MILQDAIDWFDGNFTTELGAPWRWADLMMSKPYQLLSFDSDVKTLTTPEDIEHRLVARMIANATRVKQDTGFRMEQKPKLYWRWADKVRIVDGTIAARFYIDGNPGYTKSNPQKPGGSPAAGQIKLRAA
jgi:hypothetical protein